MKSLNQKNRKRILDKFAGTSFKIWQFGQSNKFEIENDDMKILFSYNTPVAFKNKRNKKFYRTDKLFSPTTYKHIYEWVKNRKSLVVPHKEIEDAVKKLQAYGKLLAS